MDREAWWATVHRVPQSQTQLKRLSKHAPLPNHLQQRFLRKNEEKYKNKSLRRINRWNSRSSLSRGNHSCPVPESPVLKPFLHLTSHFTLFLRVLRGWIWKNWSGNNESWLSPKQPLANTLPATWLWMCFISFIYPTTSTYYEPTRASLVAQLVKNLPAMQETWVWFLGWADPWRTAWPSTLVFLPGKFHGERSLVGCSPWGRRELDTTERLSTVHESAKD